MFAIILRIVLASMLDIPELTMRRLLSAIALICVFVAFLTAIAAPPDEEQKAVSIRLKDIWARNMPGTRDVRELEPEVFGESVRELSSEEVVGRSRRSLINQIGGALPFLPEGQSARRGFAVAGTDLEALQNAHAVFTKKRQVRQSFSTADNIGVVFYSHSFNQYVHLDNVKRDGKSIEIVYRFVPHETKEMTAHFALIPLGKLPAGKYRVDIVRAPMEEKFAKQGFKRVDTPWERRVVCRPFSFTVAEND